MANNTTLQSNNANLQTILNKINELPEAGSGGSGESSVVIGTMSITDYGVYEPDYNKYLLTPSTPIDISSASFLALIGDDNNDVYGLFFRASVGEEFHYYRGNLRSVYCVISTTFSPQLDESGSITLLAYIDPSAVIRFVAV